MRRKILVSAAIIFTMLGSVAYAAPPPNLIQINEKQDVSSQIDDMEDNISKIDNQIEYYLYQIDEVKSKTDSIENEINIAKGELEKLQQQMEKTKELFNERLKTMYKNNMNGYLYLLLDSKNFGDFLSRYSTIQKIMEFDNKILSDLETQEEEINSKIQDLNNKKSEYLSMKADIETKLTEINNLKAQQSLLLLHLKESISSSNTPEANFTFSNFDSTSFGGSIVTYAAKFLGVPYVWGGTTPNGFDCSGFTQYVFAHFGISLNRVATLQARQGDPVSFSNLKPGDLVFIGFPIHHVGIYVGGGKYIHSPHTGDVVKISTLYPKYFNTGRRLR